MAVRQEVRIAVVLYGGSSLAVYINGVAQELLRLVRATAPSRDPAHPTSPLLATDQLKGSEPVYRKLGQLLPPIRGDAGLPSHDATIRTRFIVDILSGSSAGGINGIFLAKALVNEQSIDELKTLWVEEGDIGLLINDKESARGLPGVSVAVPPRSLLNGQRMYWKLLHALDGMEGKDGEKEAVPPPSRLVDELDLYVTTTDLHGLVLPITLSNKVIHEPRHRAVFHFKYGEELDAPNDFTKVFNPFLAFAARCTSSLPFVFEPMTLRDIDAIVQRSERHRTDLGARSGSERWTRFYRDYLAETIGAKATERFDPKTREEKIRDFTHRAFGDGGALDNAPFSHTTATLGRRGAEVPVDRKLFFVEPDPATYDPSAPLADTPDAIANSLMQGVTLPRKETIRDDLDRLFERNQHLGRIQRVLRDLRQDVDLVRDGPRRPRPREKLERMFLDQLLPYYGVAYGAYQRLRVGEVSAHLATLFARLLGLAEGSADATAIGYLGRAWRDRHYSHYREEGKEPFAAFLVRLDLTFTLRRLSFLRSKLDDLFDAEDPGRILHLTVGPGSELDQVLLGASDVLNNAYAAARKAGRDLRSPRPENPVLDALHRRGLADDIVAVIEELGEDATDAERRRIADAHAERLDARLSAVIEVLTREIQQGIGRAEELLAPALRGAAASEEETPSAADAVHRYLGMLFAEFIEYDMLAFPLMYGTDAGEADPVEVIRISPKDATGLVDVTIPGTTRKKVAGAEYAHFGAFFDRMWRRNDILWGRLDAAESLIEALVPPVASGDTEKEGERKERVKKLREEAQRAIIWEELDPESREELERLVATTLAHLPREKRTPQRLFEYVERELGGQLNPRLQTLIRSVLDPERLLRYYERGYSFETRMDPAPLARSLARGTHVAGQVFQEASQRRQVKLLARPTAWATRAGRLLTSMVEAAIPGTLGHLFSRHWMTVLYLLGLLTILGGVFVGEPRLQQFGWTVVGVTFLFNVTMFALGDLLRGGSRWRSVLGTAVFLLALAAVGLILLGVRHLGQDLPSLRPGGTLPPPAPTLPFESALLAGALRALAVPGLLALALLLGVWVQGRRLRRAVVPWGIVDLELAGTEARVEEIRDAWGESGISAARINLAIDFLFAAAYGVALYLLCTWAKLQWDDVWSLAAWAGVILAYGQIAAALLDLTENGLLLAILGRDQPGDRLPRIVRLLASLKFLVVGLGVVYILAGLTRFTYAEAPSRWMALLPPLGVALLLGIITGARRAAAARRRQ